jgi:tetratricopeptide (TPR) repeat protein
MKTSQLYARSQEFYAQGDVRNALRTIRQLVALSPRQPAARYWLGRILNEQGKFRSAVWHLSFAHELAPNSIDVLNELGSAYKMRKQYAKAIGCFEQVLKLAPGNAYAIEQLESCRQIPM